MFHQRNRSPIASPGPPRFILTCCFVLFALRNFVGTPTACFGEPANKSTPHLASDYIPALSAVDHLLQAWQSGDIESGLALLTAHAKQSISREDLDQLFSNARPKAYEIGRGKLVKSGLYEFGVVLAERYGHSVRRRFATVVVLNTGNNDWAVDKLPK